MLIVIIVFNLLISLVLIFFSNDFLKLNSYLFYLVQFIINIYFLIKNIKYLDNFFIPTFLFLIYLSVTQILGGYLAPRGFGWEKSFYNSLNLIENMGIIIFFNLIVNFSLTLLTFKFLRKGEYETNQKIHTKRVSNLLLLLLLLLFIFISYLQKDWIFPIQLSIFIFLIYEAQKRSNLTKWIVAIFGLLVMLIFNFESKREIIMVLFATIFLHFYINKMKFNFKTILLIPVGILSFIFFVLVASVLRGYGALDNRNLISAIKYLPQYISSDNFMDSLVDNFELNYAYSTPTIAMDYVMEGKIDFQYGMSIFKMILLVFPRSIFDFKPESLMLQFTKIYDNDFYIRGGSLPITLSSEIFLNFYLFAIPFLILIMYFFNNVFNKIFKTNNLLIFLMCVFIVSSFFMFMRGSGFDLYAFAIALASICFICILFLSRFKLK